MTHTRRKVMVVPVRMGRDWEVLILRRGPAKGSVWAPVTGNLDEGEADTAGARRELHEETGLGTVAALHDVGFTNTFQKEAAGQPIMFEESVWVAVIPLGVDPKLSHEHVDFRWVSPGEAIEAVAYDGCKEGVRRAVAAIEAKLR